MKTEIKKTARLLIVSFVLLFTVVFAQAQQQGAPRGGQQGPPPLPDDEQIGEMVAELSDELSLSETQEAQVSDAYFTHFDQVSEMLKNSNSRPDREVMEQMKKDFETDLKSVLTKDQQKQYETYMKKQQSQRKSQGKPRQ